MNNSPGFSNPSGWKGHIPVLLACLALALITGLLYGPMLQHPFINIDDHVYIYENPHVTTGIAPENLLWALTTGHASNWHPLTWISHMVDCQLFGLNPGGHHFTNLLFHIANTLLLFLLLRHMTGALLRSAIVAAFFAWHPLHVESVAWASERKDLLCAFFFFFATFGYVRYVSGSRRIFYALSLACFALGLMSKPMAVTFPFVLLLLDVWPLRRIGLGETEGTGLSIPIAPTLRRLILEKVPFFVLALASSLVTLLVQRGAMSSVQTLSPLMRVENALLSYARYFLHTIWPAKLAIIYPYPKAWPLLWVLGAFLLVIGISVWALRQARRQPWLAIGWLWFLGMLVPTIGLVQVGSQSMADRYMYLPAIGLFIAGVWGSHKWIEQNPFKPLFAIAGIAALCGCILATHAQLSTWASSVALYRHAISVTSHNYQALDGLGSALDEAGQSDEAITLFEKSIELEPRYAQSHYNLGTALLHQGRLSEAAARFRQALALDPNFAHTHNSLGTLLLREGKSAEAEKEWLQAIALRPGDAEPYYNLATMQLTESRLTAAVTNFTLALQCEPNHARAHGNLGVTLIRLGRTDDGIMHLREALRLEPKQSSAHSNLGRALLDQGKPAEAQTHFARALQLKPGDPEILARLGLSLARQKKCAEAMAELRAALRIQPDLPEAQNELAWILATHPDPSLRNGPEALRLAQRACELTKHKSPTALLTLAAACAEAGRFPDAATHAQSAQELATQSGQKSLAERALRLHALFSSGQPARE